jgi:hypothetical protein
MAGEEKDNNQIPHRPDRKIISAPASSRLELEHEPFIWKVVEHELYSLEIAELINELPAEQRGL